MAENKPGAGQVAPQPAAKDGSAQTPPAGPAVSLKLRSVPAPAAPAGKGSPILSILLAVNTLLVCFVIGVVLSGMPWRSPGTEPVFILQETPAATTSQPSEIPTEPAQAVSWKEAEEAFTAKNNAKALMLFNQLLTAAQAGDDLILDYCRFRVGQCLARMNRPKEARAAFERLAKSASPILQAVALQSLAVADEVGGQHLQARTRAYQAIAALGPIQGIAAVEADCDYLICRVLTGKVLGYYGLTGPSAWQEWRGTDPFTGLDETGLTRLLHEGTQRTSQAVLAPKLTTSKGPNGTARWSVTCAQASIEDLLQRWATASNADVRWAPVSPATRGRTVWLRSTDVSEQRLCEGACGSVGLVAQFMPDHVMVDDPPRSASLSEQRDLLIREAGAAWRRFFLRYSDDPRVPEGRAALAGLNDCAGDAAGALREYQLVATRYSRSEAAGDAMLASAKLRIRLRDYVGAQKDLTNLLDSFPEYRGIDEVYLHLGEVLLESGKPGDAFWNFKKLYDLSLGAASQAKACLGASEALHANGEYEKAVQWLRLYTGLVKDTEGPQVARAYLLWGKSLMAQGSTADAVAMFQRSVAAKPERKQYAEVLIELARVYISRDHFARALGALRRLEAEKLTEQQAYEFLQMRVHVLRSMGLVEDARMFLESRLTGITDPQQLAVLTLELARCRQAAGDLGAARRLMSEALGRLPTDRQNQAAACDLADLCLRVGDPAQAITLTTEVLRSSCPPAVRKRASEILGSAYLAQRDYERAGLAYSGLVGKQPEGKNP
jgi:tetratricopeptide (TPR) repeat protein